MQNVDEKPSKPDAPDVTGSAGASDSIDVEWKEPANTGPEISDYDVRYSFDGGTTWADHDHVGTATTTTIGSLAGSVSYAVQVRAFNDELESDWSDSGTGLTSNSSPVFINGASTMRAVDENSGADVDVGLPVAATDADGHTVGYTLEGTDAGSFAIDGGAGQLTTKSGVTYNHEEKSSYSVTVKADDGNGGSATIAVTLTISDVDEPPDSPGASTVTVTGSTTRKVTWTTPATTGRPPINGYDVRYIEASADETVDANWTDWPHSGTGTEANITGLTAVTDYKVQVKAKNNEGASDWSASGSTSTNNTAPVFTQGASTGRSVPENSAAETNIGTAIAAEDPDGHSLTDSLGGPRAGLFSIVSTSGQIQTKLGVTYDHEDQSFYIVMVNADDGNSGSATITVTITISDVDEPPAAPAAPTVTFVQGTTDRLDVSWSAPVNTGKPAITDYDVQYRMGTGSWSSWGPHRRRDHGADHGPGRRDRVPGPGAGQERRDHHRQRPLVGRDRREHRRSPEPRAHRFRRY